MRFVLFYGAIASLNHFVDELCDQMKQQGHETHIVDFRTLWTEKMTMILDQKVDAIICYDGIGMGTIDEIYDELDIPVINILMDHPMNMAFRIRKHPQKYIQLSPDENHVVYAKRFLGVENAFFLPHMASVCGQFHKIPIDEKSISVLMPGGLVSCNTLYQNIKDKMPDERTRLLALGTLEYLLDHPDQTVEKALQIYSADCGIPLPDDTLGKFMERIKDVDLFLRMYYRNRAVSLIASSGIPITLVGVGWDSLASAQRSNVTILPSCHFTEVFSYMEQAKITLTVMPWFKAGTHDRIFNSLMHYSCPLTDESSWLLENFAPNEECAYYSLKQLDELPGKVYDLLTHPEKMESIVHNGRKKVLKQYTSKQIAESVIYYLKKCYGEQAVG